LEIITSRPRIGRRSSTSNLSVSAPSSPLSVVTSLNAVKTFLSLPGSVSAHTDGKKGMYLPFDDKSEQDDLFLLANSTIDPQNLVLVQTSNSDSLSSSQTQSSDYLPMIPKAPLVSAYQSLQQKLDNSEKKLGELKKRNKSYDSDKQFQNLSVTVLPDLKESLNRVRNIHMSATTVPTILQFQPVLIAYQLTLIDSTIFRNIPMEAILTHTSKYPHPAITVSTDFFNYLTRLIEHAILLHQDASGRAQLVNHWIKVAGKCHDLKNYQTLKAVISALGTPPIQRLKRTWSFVPKKSMSLLEDLSELMSESSNYGRYRERLGIMADVKIPINPTTTTTTTTVMSAITTINTLNLVSTSTTPTPLQNKNSIDDGLALPKKSLRKNSFSEPTVPFLGTFIHDMTYLVALQQKSNNDWKGKNAPQHDPRLEELLKLFRNLQRSPPYSPTLTATCIKELNKHRKRKLSHALSRTSAMKKSTSVSNDYDAGGLSIEMQQCLVTQYLVMKKTVISKN
jgi:hypothetical protein